MFETAQEVTIIAIVQAAPGKLDRLKEVCRGGLEWMERNEPGTLEFSIYEQHVEGEDTKLLLFERYASQAAMDAHESSDVYKDFFQTMMDEELLAGTPSISKGKYELGFRRPSKTSA